MIGVGTGVQIIHKNRGDFMGRPKGCKGTISNPTGGANMNIEKAFKGEKSEIGQILNNSLYWFNYPIVKTDEECAERLNEFFKRCADNDELPTVEKMCLALGTVRQTVWRWETGEINVSQDRRDMLKKAKEIISSMDAELAAKGKIPVPTYIFRAKNYYGMRDDPQVVVQVDNSSEKVDVEAIKRRYLTDSPPTTIETTAEDVKEDEKSE